MTNKHQEKFNQIFGNRKSRKKEILKIAGYIILLIVLWFAVQDVKMQCDNYCIIKYQYAICTNVTSVEIDGFPYYQIQEINETPNFTIPNLTQSGG